MTIKAALVAASLLLVMPALADGPTEIVRNGDFELGGRIWFAGWRPLHGTVRCLRTGEEGRHYLHMRLRADGDGGLTQELQLPPGRRLALRVLATAWDLAEGGIIVTLVRVSDGKVLAEVSVDRIVRGEVARNFDTGPGGQAWLTVRLQGPKGGQGAVEWVRIGAPVPESPPEQASYAVGTGDLVLGAGAGLRLECPRGALIASAADMVQRALADVMGSRPGEFAATLRVTVQQPPASDWPARESYRLQVDRGGASVQAPAEQGARWGMMTLVDLMRPERGGGVRILAATVDDQPDLPWRVASTPGLSGDPSSAVNAVKRLVRLKLNTVIVAAGTPSDGPDAWELIGHGACSVAREWGLVPIAALSSCLNPAADTLESAVQAVIDQLQARYLLVDLCCGAWDPGLADRLIAAAQAVDPPVTLLAVLDASDRRESESRAILSQWPTEVILICGPSVVESATLSASLSSAARRGVRYLLQADGDAAGMARAALAARGRREQCLGLVGWGDELEATANAAWRVPQ